jgi:hypothetical protein
MNFRFVSFLRYRNIAGCCDWSFQGHKNLISKWPSTGRWQRAALLFSKVYSARQGTAMKKYYSSNPEDGVDMVLQNID